MRGSFRRRLRLLSFAVVVFALALEALLQLGAVALAWTSEPVEVLERDEPHVLCVGDSFTFGVGATVPERSYPAVLERNLAAAGCEIRVINAGRPGRNTRAGLEFLEDRIRPSTRVVCILLGTNDEWSRPERLPAAIERTEDDASSGSGFEWKWRTGELMAVAFRFSFGSWHRTAAPDESNSVPAAASTDDAARIRAGLALLVEYAGAAGVMPTELQQPLVLMRDRALGERPAAIIASLKGGDTEGALRLARDALAAQPRSAHALALLANAQRLVSDDPAATVQRIRDVVATDSESGAADWLIWTLREVGRSQAAIAAARARVATHPTSVTAWNTLQQASLALGDLETFCDAAIKTLLLLQASSPSSSARIMRDLAGVARSAPAEQLARLLVGAQLLDPDSSMTIRRLEIAGRKLPLEVVQSALRRTESRVPTITAEFEPILDEVYRGKTDTRWRDVMRDHLERMGRVAQAAGAEVVIVSYPNHDAVKSMLQADAARRIGARFVLLSERFGTELKTRPRSELFVPDGHCADAGYDLIAELVAEQVVELLGR